MASKATRLWVSSLLISSWAASAQADECQKNEDCPKGFACEANRAVPACDAEDAPACAPGEKCPAPPPSCGAAIETHRCEPARCESAADCGDGMVCFKRSFPECSGSAGAPPCAPGEACAMPAPPPDEPSCPEREVAQCVPRYLLPCEQASDCGAGFRCVAAEECTCKGSGGAAADGGAPKPGGDSNGFAPPPAPPPTDAGAARPASMQDAAVGGNAPVCTCRASEQKHCELEVMRCESDRECPRDFACKTYGSSGSVSCARSDGGAETCESAFDAPAEKRCAPRYEAPTRGGQSTSGSPTYEMGEDADHAADAGAAPPQQQPADAKSCSVISPRAGALGSLFAPLAFVLLALGLRARRKQ